MNFVTDTQRSVDILMLKLGILKTRVELAWTHVTEFIYS